VRVLHPAGAALKRAIGLLVLFFALALAFILRAYERDLRRAHARISTGGQIAQTRCGPIEYASIGTGPTVLLVHGAGGGFDQGLHAAARLAKADLRIVLMSRFGYLQTPLPADASAAAQADAHACLLDALAIERAAIVGASAGAPSAMQFALRHPGRCSALVLLVPAAYVARPGDEAALKTPRGTQLLFDTALRSDFLFWAIIRLAPETVMRSFLATPPDLVHRASAEEQARIAQMMDGILPVSPRRLGLLNDAAITSALGRYELERISVPTLTISAADDLFGTYETARYSAEHIPGARFIGYPTGGHLWVGHHTEVLTAIAAFVQR
jgi:pimeloyl-ACP methyl ester carboxylesterase